MIDLRDKNSRDRWLYLMLPYQIAYNPISSLVALYILYLHGNVLDVSFAVALSNLLGIVASLFWGDLIDRYNRRRVFMAISFSAVTLSLLGFYFMGNVVSVILIYGLLSFMVTANATPINLLVMETNARKKWLDGFSKLQVFSGIGNMLGYVFVFMLSGFLGVGYLMLLLVPFSLIALAYVGLIKEPEQALGKKSILESTGPFTSRILTLFLFFVRVPSRQRVEELVKKIVTVNVPRMSPLNLLYLATFIFYIGSSLFNTAYVAGLNYKGVSNFEVFLILLVGSTIQTTAFYFSGALAKRKLKSQVASSYLLIRGFGYVAIALGFALFGTIANLWMGLIFYPIAAGLAYAMFFTTFNTMVFEEIGSDGNKGMKLGLYSGFAGFGALIGAMLAGFLSYFIGFWFSFAVSGALIFATAYLILLISARHK